MSSRVRLAQERWRRWFSALGPGAIVASLTIGMGELVFSTRGGALFGYRVLGIFGAVLVLKWALVFASARHWVWSDVHPLRRWTELPGPPGWLPWVLLLLALPAFPVWVSFHSGSIGTLLAALTDTRDHLNGNASLVWGLATLVGAVVLSLTGGYGRQEKVQAAVVALMIVAVVISLVRLRPDWSAFLWNWMTLEPLRYPDWARDLPEFAGRPVWVEVATYAGVIGGSGYDYLAYVAWLREKHGPANQRQVDERSLQRLIAADATVSFLTVLLFSAAFVACGVVVLSPQHQVPAGQDLLTLQAQFVSAAGAWLKPLYYGGALLALGGTLYGTIEVAPAILREITVAVSPPGATFDERRVRNRAVLWCGAGGVAILVVTLAWRMMKGTPEPFRLVTLVTPANLFTGVLACGWISLLNVWADWRFLPKGKRARWPLLALNLVGGIAFSLVGLKAAWDVGRWIGPAVLVGSVVAGGCIAAWRHRSPGRRIPAGNLTPP